MIKNYDWSNRITFDDVQSCKKIIDDLIFNLGNYCTSCPTFQTWPNLYTYDQFEIFVDTLLESCNLYFNKKVNIKRLKLWSYVDYYENSKEKKEDVLWHNHHEDGENKISAIYYLINPKNEGTEFIDFKITNPKYFNWYIYPSHLYHRAPLVTSIEKRYILASDIYF